MPAYVMTKERINSKIIFMWALLSEQENNSMKIIAFQCKFSFAGKV